MESIGNGNELIQDLRQQPGTRINQKFLSTTTPTVIYLLIGVFLFQVFTLLSVYSSQQDGQIMTLQSERRIADRIELSAMNNQDGVVLVPRHQLIKYRKATVE